MTTPRAAATATSEGATTTTIITMSNAPKQRRTIKPIGFCAVTTVVVAAATAFALGCLSASMPVLAAEPLFDPDLVPIIDLATTTTTTTAPTTMTTTIFPQQPTTAKPPSASSPDLVPIIELATTTTTPSVEPTNAPTVAAAEPLFDPDLVPVLKLATTTTSPCAPPTTTTIFAQPSSSTTRQPTTTAEPPSASSSSSAPIAERAFFRQEFVVGVGGSEFDAEVLVVFETLYRRFTADFSPLPRSEVAAKIETKCTVSKQILHDDDHLTVEYLMEYSSRHYDVTEYPELFREWTGSDSMAVLEQLWMMKLNVSVAEAAERLVVSATQVPSTEPTATTAPPSDTARRSPSEDDDIPISEPEDASFVVLLVGMLVMCCMILHCCCSNNTDRRWEAEDGTSCDDDDIEEANDNCSECRKCLLVDCASCFCQILC